MIQLTLAQVAAATRGELGGGADPAAVVSGPVTADSREAGPGALFVALPGDHVDGHDYAAAAVAAGAVAVLASRDVGVPAVLVADPLAALGRLARLVVDILTEESGLVVVGVTGSSGKTSTKDLLAAVLAGRGPVVAPVGSFNNELGVPLTALRADATTSVLVAEMGARAPGHIAHLCGITPPRIGVVLNVGRAHAEIFGDTEATARTKGELVAALPSDGLAVLNVDDPRVAAMTGRTNARVVGFGIGSAGAAQVRAAEVALDDAARASFVLVTPEGEAPVRLRLHGVHHVGNALAAAAVARELGLSVAATAEALSAAEPGSRWRMEVTQRPDGLTVVNDAYNANPDSVAAALRALATMGRDRRTWAVLGEMLELGGGSAEEHRAAGELAARLGVDEVVAVGAGAAPAATGATQTLSDRTTAHLVPDGEAALELLRAEAGPTDVVLVKASRGVGLDRLAAALLADVPLEVRAP